MSLTTLPPHSQLQHHLDTHRGKLVVILFCADWSKNSLLFRDRILQTLPLFGQFDNVVYLLIKAEESQEVLQQFSIQAVPSVIFTDYRKTLIRRFQTEDVGIVLDALAEESENYRSSFEKEKASWVEKIGIIVREESVLVFSEGRQQNALNNQLVGLLSKHKVQFSYVNVLQSKFMGGWIKIFSNCQQFPLLYINNRFVGNTIACEQLEAKGAFLPLIPASSLLNTPQQTLQSLISTHKILVLTEYLTYQSKEFQQYLQQLTQKYDNPTLFNLSINQPLLSFVSSKYPSQLPLLFLDGILTPLSH